MGTKRLSTVQNRPLIQKRIRAALWTGFLVLLSTALAVPFSSAQEEEYSFVDESGREIVFPKDLPVYSDQNPGPWRQKSALHAFSLKTRIRKEGLEAVRLLDIEIPHPMDVNGGEDGRIEEIFVLDKDDLIIGYHAFDPEATKAKTRLFINGVINYVQIYVRCSVHGLWRREFRFP